MNDPNEATATDMDMFPEIRARRGGITFGPNQTVSADPTRPSDPNANLTFDLAALPGDLYIDLDTGQWSTPTYAEDTITAAGGWCAPTDTVYDPNAAMNGSRGGVTYGEDDPVPDYYLPVSPDFCGVVLHFGADMGPVSIRDDYDGRTALPPVLRAVAVARLRAVADMLEST